MTKFKSLFVTLAVLIGMVAPVWAGSFNDEQKKEMEDIIHSYLIGHPEVLREMSNALQEQEQQATAESRNKVLGSVAKDIFHNPADGVVGNPNGDVTVVEFLDYNCFYCHKSVKEIQAILGTDKNVRVVMKEWPIFGFTSEFAARAALASTKQNKYWAFHQALFDAVLPDEDTAAGHAAGEAAVLDVAKSVGIDLAKLKVDMKDPAIATEMARTQELAGALQFTGTPGFVIDSQVIPGYEEKDKLLAVIAGVRANGGCKVC